jgi:AraC family transcriptional regulator of adaptative response / DNA-3-methyladenine glycosylase II
MSAPRPTTILLPFTPPLDWRGMLAFLCPRAIPGVEAVEADGYRRTIRVDGKAGAVTVVRIEDEPVLRATVTLAGRLPEAPIALRLRRLFDLDAVPQAIEAHLGRDPRLAPLLAARPGLRVPGAWDGFELAVRAILGQQVSVAAATTLAGRLAAAYGQPVRSPDRQLGILFPQPAALAEADLAGLGLPAARAAAIVALARAVRESPDLLGAQAPLEATVSRLSRLPGIGAWTAHYIAMRALGQADAFPASDLGLRRALAGAELLPAPADLLQAAEAWRPWRAYAAMHLWLSRSAANPGEGRC